jgi:hypothetical protein
MRGICFNLSETATDTIFGFNFYDAYVDNNLGFFVKFQPDSQGGHMFIKYNDDSDGYWSGCDGSVKEIGKSSVGPHRGWIWYNSTNGKTHFKLDENIFISLSCVDGNPFKEGRVICLSHVAYTVQWWNITYYNYTLYGFNPPIPAPDNSATLSNPICTSCIVGTNKTPDITPTINITCTSSAGCQGVRISNDSTFDYMNATSDRNCSRGDEDTWVCTLPASDQISAEQTSLYFWANSSAGEYHLAWNETIALTYNLGFNTSFGAGISKIKWIVPFYTGTTAYNVSPVNETDSVGLWIVGNNGTATGQVSMRLNASYPSVVTECARDSLYNDELILNESWQIINSSLLYGERCPIWCRRNYTAIPVKQVINWQFNFTSI